jgi:hypothetical protein
MAKRKPAWWNVFAFVVALGIEPGTLTISTAADKGFCTGARKLRLDTARRRPQTVTFDAEPFFRSHVRQRRLRGRFRL